MSSKLIPHRLRMHVQERPDAPAYFVREATGWKPTSWKTYVEEIETAARALLHLGVAPGQSPAIIGFNAPSWSIAFMASTVVRGKPTGIYTTNSAEELAYIAGHAESPVLFIEDEHQWNKVQRVRDKLPNLKHIVLFRGHPAIPDSDALTWDEFMALGAASYQEELEQRLAQMREEDIATLIYTSGTTGPPKAVILTHANLVAATEIAEEITNLTPDERLLSYLPLSHIAEQVVSIHGPAYAGCAVYYATSLEELAQNLPEVKPTIIFGVPRVWEKVYDGITGQLESATGIKKQLVNWALSVGKKAVPYRLKDQMPAGLLGLQYRLADRLVFSTIRETIGLDEAHLVISGAAPIVPEVLEFFTSINIVIQEIYGQSETTALTTFNLRGQIKARTVGRPVPNVQVKIAEDGEILVKGGNVSPGYFKNDEATQESYQDGWLKTGDLGVFDADGYLQITGRKKEIIITAGGKNIAPNNVERAIKRHPLVNEAVLIGDQRKYLTALLTLEPESLEEWARSKQIAVKDAHKSEELQQEIQAHIDRINPEFARVEQVKKFRILPENFSVEAGQLTPSLKIKRRVIVEQFEDEIEQMYR